MDFKKGGRMVVDDAEEGEKGEVMLMRRAKVKMVNVGNREGPELGK